MQLVYKIAAKIVTNVDVAKNLSTQKVRIF